MKVRRVFGFLTCLFILTFVLSADSICLAEEKEGKG